MKAALTEHEIRSISAKNSWCDPEIRKRRVEALRKAHRSSIVRKRHSEATRKFLTNPNNLKKRKETLKKAWAKPEKRAKLENIIQLGLAAALSEKGRANHKKANQDPELRKSRSHRAKENISKILRERRKYSKLNKFFKEQMKLAGLNPCSEYPIGPYCVDFCFPKYKLVVEADGDWWHGNPVWMKERGRTTLHPIQKKMIRLDKAKDTYLKNHDWKILRFWERQVYRETSCCIDDIRKKM